MSESSRGRVNRSILSSRGQQIRVAVICDLPEETWHSMDLVADMLLHHLRADHSATVQATGIRPNLKRRLSNERRIGEGVPAWNADRLINRFWDYPRLLKRESSSHDLFHIVDHSYAQLVHYLDPARTIVTCHDLDTFRSVIEPERHRRSRLFVAMTKRILNGLRKAALVACDSKATHDELLAHQIIPPERAVIVPLGVHPTCSTEPDSEADAVATKLLGPPRGDAVDLLHVGSTIARKRIDVLLRVFAAIKKEFPSARLIRAGGAFRDEQRKLVEQLGIAESVVVLRTLNRPVLAAIYRRAALLLLPSEREGFGLPLIEAMACGTPVIASDLDVLHEVGSSAATYCSIGDVHSWSDAAIKLLRERQDEQELWHGRRKNGLAQAANFTWAEYSRKMVDLYHDVWHRDF